jgi:hypothetical protein
MLIIIFPESPENARTGQTCERFSNAYIEQKHGFSLDDSMSESNAASSQAPPPQVATVVVIIRFRAKARVMNYMRSCLP